MWKNCEDLCPRLARGRKCSSQRWQNIQEKASHWLQKEGCEESRQFDSGQGEGRNIYPHSAVTRNETQVCKTNRGRADNHQGGRGIRAES